MNLQTKCEMAYINLDNTLPGIRGLVAFRPETGQYLYQLAQVLLRGESPIPEADRELIAAYVSKRNNCVFCSGSHAAAARCLYGDAAGLVDQVLDGQDDARVTAKLRSLLNIAGKVQVLGTEVQPDDIERAREAGASEREIHDAVLIAAAFSMYNRYVDGLASFTPTDPETYAAMGERMAGQGYVMPPSK